MNLLFVGASESPEPQKRKKMTLGDAFNQDEEEESQTTKKHRLVPLVYSDEEKAGIGNTSKPTTAEEKRKCIKNLIEKIPTGKTELFAFVLDWSMVDQVRFSINLRIISVPVVLSGWPNTV